VCEARGGCGTLTRAGHRDLAKTCGFGGRGERCSAEWFIIALQIVDPVRAKKAREAAAAKQPLQILSDACDYQI